MIFCDYCRKYQNGAYFANELGYTACESCMKNIEAVETLSNGAKQSKLDCRMDLLPWQALLHIASIMKTGAEKYGVDNWRGIPAESHLNHALRHIALWKSGDTTEDHKGNAACRMLMFLECAK